MFKAFAIASLGTSLLPTASLSEEITVATWNLSNFSGTNHLGCNGRGQIQYDEMRKIILAVDADVWLFQEVESAGSLARIMDPSSWALIAETRPETSAGTCNQNDQRMTMQRTAIAVKKKIAIGKPNELKFLDVKRNNSLRYGISHKIAVSGKSIEIINVHLKSGCFTGTDSGSCSVLFEQIPFLASHLTELSESNVPVIIGGDFNRRLGEAGDEAMFSLGFSKTSEMTIETQTVSSKCSLNGSAPIDYILVNKHMRELASEISSQEHSFTGPFESWPSDHCPTILKLKIL